MGVINTNPVQKLIKNYQFKNSHKMLNHGKPQMHDEGGGSLSVSTQTLSCLCVCAQDTCAYTSRTQFTPHLYVCAHSSPLSISGDLTTQ